MKVSFLFTNIYENRKKKKDIITYVAYVPEKKIINSMTQNYASKMLSDL